MKIKFKYNKHHKCWHAGYYRGNGGINSLITAFDGTFWWCLKRMVKRFFYAIANN